MARNEIKVWLDSEHPAASTPLDVLALDGWSGLATSYLKLVKKNHGKTIYGERIVETRDAPMEIPRYEAYELFCTARTELALGLAHGEIHKIAKSILRAAAALIIDLVGFGLTDYGDIYDFITKITTPTPQLKRVIEWAYKARKRNDVAPWEFEQDLCFQMFQEWDLSFQNSYYKVLATLSSTQRQTHENLLNEYRTRTTEHLVLALDNNNLWPNFELLCLFHYEIDMQIFQLPAKAMGDFVTHAWDNQLHQRLIGYAIKSAEQEWQRISNLFDAMLPSESKDRLVDNIYLHYRLNVMAQAFGYKKESLKISDCIYSFFEHLEAATGRKLINPIFVLCNRATNYCTHGDHEQAIKLWQQAIGILEKKCRAEQIKLGAIATDRILRELRINFITQDDYLHSPYAGLAVTYQRMGKLTEALNILLPLINDSYGTHQPFRNVLLRHLYVAVKDNSNEKIITSLVHNHDWLQLKNDLQEELKLLDCPNLTRILLSRLLRISGDYEQALQLLNEVKDND